MTHLPSCPLHQHTSFRLFAGLSEMIVHIVELSFFVAPADSKVLTLAKCYVK